MPGKEDPFLPWGSGEEAIMEWQDPKAFPFYPPDFIVCPLKGGTLKEAYSLSTLGVPASYLNQEKAMVEFFSNPPLTKPLPTTTPKRVKASMEPLEPSTIETRVRTMREFVGFCSKWLNLTPTMELVMHPQQVAKFIGFHVAKGTSESTLKRIATHLEQVASKFITSGHCPSTSTMGMHDERGILEWYTNLNGKIMASISTHYTTKDHGITLWSVWQACLTKWEAFLAKLKVSIVCHCGCWHANTPPPHDNPFICSHGEGAQGQVELCAS
jgi:hypothetical protein